MKTNSFPYPGFKRALDGKKHLFLITALLFFSVIQVFADSTVLSYDAVLQKNVIDLRGTSQFRSSSNNQPGRVYTPEDLKVGSVFITVDNKARKVVGISEHNGKTVIDTIQPRPEEVFLGLNIPDFEIACDRSNIDPASLAEGVTLLPEGTSEKEMISSSFSTSGLTEKSVTWLETDPDTEGMDTIAFNINIPLWTTTLSPDVVQSLKDKKEDAATKTEDTGIKPSLDIGASGEVRLIGTLRLAEPVVTGGLKMPSVSVSWVHDWWIIYHPVFHYSGGYAKAGFSAAQQFDFKLTGTIKLTSELRIPLYAIVVKYYAIDLILGVYAKIGLDGSISLSVEVSEFTKHSINTSCDLIWPFIPDKLSATQDSYLDFAFRPTIAASARLRAGLYLGAQFQIAGMSIAGAEGGGGAYIKADGYIEPLGIMGFDTIIGGYGNFDDWILDLSAEAGAYVEVVANILTIGIPIYNHEWPFWEWHKDWEF